jgi:hypothetical protein
MGGGSIVRHLKPALLVITLIAPLLGVPPAALAAAKAFELGTPIASPKALPATPGDAAAKPVKASATKAKPSQASKKAASKPSKRVSKAAAKSKSRKTADAIANGVPPAKIDLTLPKDMVEKLQPPGQENAAKAKVAQSAEAKPLLPSLFGAKSSAEPFQLDGRLLTNEMDLQLRNENRRDVEGAALDFKFRQ